MKGHQVQYATAAQVDGWMVLVERMRSFFPGLETAAALAEYRQTVLRFIEKRQALLVESDGKVAGVLLFSRKRRMICFLAVSPDNRRQGVATALMQEALSALGREAPVTVATYRAEDEKGAAARAFYERINFLPGALIEELGYPNQLYTLYPPEDEAKKRHQAINRMVAEIGAVLAECEPSVYLYGSCVLDDFKLGWSDIDLLVLTQRPMSEKQANTLLTLRQTLMVQEPGNPYYRAFEGGMLTLEAFLQHTPDRVVYWGTSGERMKESYELGCFSQLELLENGQLLAGRDVRDKMARPDFSALCEGVQAHYGSIRRCAQKTERNLYSFGWMLDIARCLYTLRTGKIAAKTVAGAWALENGLCPDSEALAEALAVRRAPLMHRDAETMDRAEQFGEPVQHFADVLEAELVRVAQKIQK